MFGGHHEKNRCFKVFFNFNGKTLVFKVFSGLHGISMVRQPLFHDFRIFSWISSTDHVFSWIYTTDRAFSCFFSWFHVFNGFILRTMLFHGFFMIYSWIYTMDHPYDPQIHAATIQTATTHKKPPSRYTRHATRQYWKLRKGGGDITGIDKFMNISMKYHGIKIFSWLQNMFMDFSKNP
jgi:hypothetical protein